MSELQRFLRHGLAPLVTWMVSEEYLPEAMQKDVLEALVIGVSLAVPYLWSWLRERAK